MSSLLSLVGCALTLSTCAISRCGKERVYMKLRPQDDRAIDRFMVATVETVSRPAWPRSPSVVTLDGTSRLRDAYDPIGGENLGAVQLQFDSQGVVPLTVGRRYLFALAGDVCTGFFDVDEPGQVTLPGASPRTIEEVARAGLYHTMGELLGEPHH